MNYLFVWVAGKNGGWERKKRREAGTVARPLSVKESNAIIGVWRSARSGGASPGRSQEDTRL